MNNFVFNIDSTPLILFGSAVILAIVLVFIYLRPAWRVRNAVRRQEADTAEPSASCPVSVIVFASDEAEALRKLLPSILGQRYNGPFEVIVVNEGQSDNTSEVVERLRLIHDNLYLTFTPDGARQLSRKKLALMIGIKAARYPVVVHTIAGCTIDSDLWLARMTEPFVNPSVEVVLGCSTIDQSNDTGFGRRSRTFNAAADDVVWLAAALDGHPYRGTELSLAYTRDAFFKNRGFSRSLNLKYGDDDIFVNEIARGDNTAIVLHPDTIVKRNAWNAPRLYRELRARYRFTGRQLPMIHRGLQAAASWMLWAILILCVTGAVIMLPNLLGAAIGAFIVLATFISASVIWKRTIAALTGRRLLLTLPWLMLMRPFANIAAAAKSWRHRKRNYTWVK